MSVAQRIRATRRDMGLSQSEFASLLSVSVKAVGRWERGEDVPRRKRLEYLAEKSGRRLSWLLDSEDDLLDALIGALVELRTRRDVVVDREAAA